MYKIHCPHCEKDADLLHSRKVWITGIVEELYEEGDVVTVDEEESGDVIDSQFECGHCARILTEEYVRENAIAK